MAEGRGPMLVDSHCHLDFPDFAAERDAVIGRARAAGVETMLTICTRLDQFDGVRAIAEAYDGIWCSVGAHPHEAADHAPLLTEQLLALTEHPKVVGIGETGLDFHYDLSPRDIQERVFRVHIAASRASGLPLIIHAREADREIARILEEERPPPGVLHCFSSGRALAETAIALGFYVSISGIVTFRNAEELRAIVRDLPLDRLLVETDAPYLAPVPYRGKRNEPAFVAATAAAVAALKGARSAAPRGGDARQFLPPLHQGDAVRRMRVTVLGCGASTGVPAIGPNWGRCDPADPRNRRRRVSALVEIGDVVILIDTSPDLREQLIDARVSRLDAVIVTHAHADHLHGIDDLRSVNRLMRRAIPLFADAKTLSRDRPALRLCPRAVAEPGRYLQADPRAARDRRPLRDRRDPGHSVRAGPWLQHDARSADRRLCVLDGRHRTRRRGVRRG